MIPSKVQILLLVESSHGYVSAISSAFTHSVPPADTTVVEAMVFRERHTNPQVPSQSSGLCLIP